MSGKLTPKAAKKATQNSTNKYHFKNLVFEGGGVKGIA